MDDFEKKLNLKKDDLQSNKPEEKNSENFNNKENKKELLYNKAQIKNEMDQTDAFRNDMLSASAFFKNVH